MEKKYIFVILLVALIWDNNYVKVVNKVFSTGRPLSAQVKAVDTKTYVASDGTVGTVKETVTQEGITFDFSPNLVGRTLATGFRLRDGCASPNIYLLEPGEVIPESKYWPFPAGKGAKTPAEVQSTTLCND